MKVLEYTVLDPLVILGLPAAETLCYAKIGEEGLLEDYLTRKGFFFYDPVEVEKPDDFLGFSIVFMNYAPRIDLANGQLVFKPRQLEPWVN